MLIALADIAAWMVTSRDEGKIVVWAMIGAAAGVYLFFRGFRMLQFKRLVLNTPLSRVRSASMGLVELSGMALGPQTIPAGITGDPCYYYRATAWELRQSGNRRQWKQVASESLFVPFFLQDDTGKMLVNAQGADMDVHRNFKDEFGGSFFSSTDMPMGSVQDFMLRYGIAGRHVRLEEYCIKPEYPLFVLGTLGESHVRARMVPEKHASAMSSSINLRWRSGPTGNGVWQMLGGTPGTQIELDRPTVQFPLQSARQSQPARPAMSPISRHSQIAASAAPAAASSWSSISMDEVHPPRAAAQIAASTSVAQMDQPLDVSHVATAQLLRESASTSLPDMPPLQAPPTAGFDLNASVAIGKGDNGAPFTISCESQRELVRALGWKSTACIWGGPALTVTCIYILAITLGWL
jgi:E3 ubiquitin ligase